MCWDPTVVNAVAAAAVKVIVALGVVILLWRGARK